MTGPIGALKEERGGAPSVVRLWEKQLAPLVVKEPDWPGWNMTDRMFVQSHYEVSFFFCLFFFFPNSVFANLVII